MAIIPIDLINKLFGVVLKNAEHIGGLVREMETIDQIWYMTVSFSQYLFVPLLKFDLRFDQLFHFAIF